MADRIMTGTKGHRIYTAVAVVNQGHPVISTLYSWYFCCSARIVEVRDQLRVEGGPFPLYSPVAKSLTVNNCCASVRSSGFPTQRSEKMASTAGGDGRSLSSLAGVSNTLTSHSDELKGDQAKGNYIGFIIIIYNNI